MTFFTVIISILIMFNLTVWLAISSLILYNLYGYTVDKHNMRQDLPAWLRKYARMI